MRLWLSSLWLLGSLVLPAWGGDLPAPEPPAPVAAAAEDPFADPFAAPGPPATLADPLEPLNRGVFWLNDRLYFYLFKPVARALRLVPEPARVALGNVYANLGTPVRFANALLQLQFDAAGDELARFLVNSTVGLGGLFDPARERDGLRRREEDLGLTLGHYGVGQGFYLVLPVLGPTTVRDGLGGFGDYFLQPLPYVLDSGELLASSVLEQENRLSLDKETYEGIKEQELDPYLFIRNAYAQRRAAQLRR
jgi:phospholipid-binding lipoprotein MlaA